MKTILLLLCYVFVSPSIDNGIVEESSNHVEINHVYRFDEKEQEYVKRMTQIIWWEWRDNVLLPVKDSLGNETGDWRSTGAFVVRDFKVTWSESSSPKNTRYIIPRKEKNKYICLFYDKDDKIIRKITSRWMIITHTDHDREVENRRFVKMEHRNKLITPKRVNISVDNDDTNVIMEP